MNTRTDHEFVIADRMQGWLARAARELGIRIVVGHVVHLPEGIAFPTQALFPDLGGPRGMLVLDSSDTLDGSSRRALVHQGFSMSTFSRPGANEGFDIGSYGEMFEESGWTSDERPKPNWMD